MIGALPAGIVNGLFPQNQMQTTSEPFQWGVGGRRMTPEDIARERRIAASLMQSDYSPVQHWTQGLGRVADNVLGAFRERDADKASADNQAYSRSRVAEILSNPGGTPSASGPPGVGQSSAPGGSPDMLLQALSDPYLDPSAKAIAQMQLEQQQKMAMKQFERNSQMWEDNAGNRWRLGANGMPEIVFHDKNAKRIPQKVFDADGNEYIEYVEVPNAYGADGQPVAAASPAPDKLPANFFDEDDGTGGSGSPPPMSAGILQPWQYEGFVNSMGKAAADEFLRRQGLTVGGR